MKLTGMKDAATKFIQRLAKPAQPPSNIILLVILRSSSILLLFASMVLWMLACLYRPWKIQRYKGDTMEVSVWTICRVSPKFYKCYDEFYTKNSKWWFVFFRYLMIAGILIQLITLVYIIIEMIRRELLELKPYLIGTYGSFLAGLCYFTSLILFYLKFEWEFADESFGWPIMGWNEETPDKDDFIETVGYPYIIAWVGMITLLIASYTFFYTKCYEDIFIIEEEKKQKAANQDPSMLDDISPNEEETEFVNTWQNNRKTISENIGIDEILEQEKITSPYGDNLPDNDPLTPTNTFVATSPDDDELKDNIAITETFQDDAKTIVENVFY